MDYLAANSNNLSTLYVKSESSFTLHYAIIPYVGLISLIITVWLLVYLSTVFSRRYNLKNEHRQVASLYLTQATTYAGGHEASTVISRDDV
ncbi:unnamed protein product [Rotaria sordida]|nr:unnamed protein product [Rotaria sordida]CAF0903539.1 unnamed protein product [Rotaria sordida]CAF0905050.1 unnamed protein product [Rotaria sordida]CAF0912413.1 unnamed protein product [Rotaria sordida]CAF0924629.1 unnamed protein product [Rotaria sordida]